MGRFCFVDWVWVGGFANGRELDGGSGASAIWGIRGAVRFLRVARSGFSEV